MRTPPQTRALVLILASAALAAEVDVREIVRRTVAAEERNWKVARSYGFSSGWTRAGWTPRDG
jgi:hypothetical protein